MSKCPDAVYVENLLDPVLQELKGILALNMRMVPGEKKTDGSYACKHGTTECAGNIQDLCVQQYTRVPQRYNWLYKFVMCCNSKDMYCIGDLETATTCLKEAKIPDVAATKIMSCIADPGKDEMLQRDLRNTAALGVQKSCTIKVEGKYICLRDGGQWKDCPGGTNPEDFKAIFCAAFAAKNNGRMPRVCQVPRKTPLTAP
ncbi:hypothetical protein OEZ86_007516 [Tetradesmus obliquus]|nr:hypothetical protein OEZ86_007516 [Tetradesmus obliquus]